MNFRSFRSFAVGAVLVVVTSVATRADDDARSSVNEASKASPRGEKLDRLDLFDSLESPSTGSSRYADRKALTMAELKLARAIERADARAARIEYNAWIGHSPLRPTWNATPMTTSRYAPRVVYVPVYFYGR